MTLHVKTATFNSISKAFLMLVAFSLGLPLTSAPAWSQLQGKGELSRGEAGTTAKASWHLSQEGTATPQEPVVRPLRLNKVGEELEALDRTVPAHLGEASIEEAVRGIAHETDVEFAHPRQAISVEKNISLNAEEVSVQGAFHESMRGTDLKVTLVPGTDIWVKQREAETTSSASLPSERGALQRTTVASVGSPVMQGTITGTVTDSLSGESIPGVNVVIAGSQQGASTDANGQYTISGVEPGTYTLRASFVGYATKMVEGVEVAEGETVEVDFALVESALALEEVVAIGYGEQQRRDVTGSVASVSADEFAQGVNTSPGQLLQGKVAGARVAQTTGEPGGGISIRIRGASSINAGNEPLYVIDGYPIDNSPTIGATAGNAGLGGDPSPRDPLSTINPEDIESIEILKDASATAIYGSRGANGVVLITTKKGARNDFQINYSASAGIQQEADRIDVLSAQQYMNVINGINQAAGRGVVFTQSEIEQIGEGTNWQDEIFRTAPVTNHTLSFSGGNPATTYRGSVNYFNQQGLVERTGIEKYIGRLNLQRDFDGNRGSVGFNVNGSVVDNLNSTENLTINESSGPINAALLYDPTEPVRNEDGSFNRSPNLTIDNPMAKVVGVSSKGRDTRTFGNVFLEYNITSDLSARVNFGFDLTNSKRDLFNSSQTINGDGQNGIANIATLERTNILAEYTMRYNTAIGDNHSLNLLGGFTFEEFNSESFAGNISNFSIETLGPHNLNLGDTGNDDLTSFKSINRLASYFGRTNYQFLDKYLFTATLRVDGSSRFGANNKFGIFPSFAVGWRLSEEPFTPDLFDDLKLRVSYGETGNQEIGNDVFLSTFVPSGNVAFGEAVANTLAPSRVANPDLKWETTKQLDVGVDVSIWNSRVTGSLDWFLKRTTDVLLNRPLPPASGFSSQIENVGEIENTGVELQLETRNVQHQNFFWDTSFNVAHLDNKVTNLGGIGPIITGSLQDVGNTTIFREGDPMASYYGFVVEGIFQTEEEIANSAQPGAIPGHVRFKDQNGDGTINADDRVIVGNPSPDWTFGMTNTLSYRGLQFEAFLQGQLGAQLLNQNRLQSATPTNFRRNRIAEQALDRWTPDNPDAKWPIGVNPTANLGGKEVNTLYLDDASYLRLKSVRVSYNIPTNLIRSATIYVTGENLLTITDYIGSNPEANALGRSNVQIDMSTFPIARSYTVGLNLSF